MSELVISIVLSCFGMLFALFYVNRVSKGIRISLDEHKDSIFNINSQLKPIISNNARTMSIIQNMGNDIRIEKTLDRKIGEDMIGQYSDIIEGVRLAFPQVAEYIDERPEAIIKLMPRLQTLITDPELRKRLKFDESDTKKYDLSRIWNQEQ